MMRTLMLMLALLLAGCTKGHEPVQGCAALKSGTMRWVPGGSFTMGEAPQLREEGPPRRVAVPGFWIAEHELTNAEFAAFVAATGYKTLADRTPPITPDTPPEMRQPGSAVFTVPDAQDHRWWRWVVGADWRHPEGPSSTVTGKDTDPVVQIAYEDALAYARWARLDLPGEAQWEYAARGGAAAAPVPVSADGRPLANYYQGVFPARDLGTDGFTTRAPVGCFPPNAYGLYDMIGNVWELTQGLAPDGASHVIKGGSYLCASNYCARYRAAARQFQEIDLGTDHVGVRLVDNHRPPPKGYGT